MKNFNFCAVNISKNKPNIDILCERQTANLATITLIIRYHFVRSLYNIPSQKKKINILSFFFKFKGNRDVANF